MKITILAIGHKMPSWVEAGVKAYQSRFPPDVRISLKAIATARRTATNTAHQCLQQESSRLLKSIPQSSRVIALDVKGTSWSTEELAQKMAHWKLESPDVTFLIGGPDGLSQDCLDRAQERWSLSALTFPHALARIILLEQLYRAWSILAGHPYHRE